MKKVFIAIAIFCSLVSIAQQDAQFTHYSFNQLYNNPAYAGVKGIPSFKLIHRSQWLGYSPTIIDEGGAPTSQVLSFETPVKAIKGGVGLLLMTDRVGPQRYSSAQLSLSKYIAEIGNGKLQIGLQANYSLMQLGLAAYRPPEEGTVGVDPSIPTSSTAEGFFDMSAGAWYEHNDFYAGFAINKLLDNDFSFTQSLDSGGFVKHMYLNGGYYIKSVYNWVFMPTLLIKSSLAKGGARTQFELGGIATYKDDMWGGLNFRQGEAMSILLGKSFMKNKELKLGYALDLTIKGVAGKAFTSHELMLAYNLPDPKKNLRPAIRTPRFRF